MKRGRNEKNRMKQKTRRKKRGTTEKDFNHECLGVTRHSDADTHCLLMNDTSSHYMGPVT